MVGLPSILCRMPQSVELLEVTTLSQFLRPDPCPQYSNQIEAAVPNNSARQGHSMKVQISMQKEGQLAELHTMHYIQDSKQNRNKGIS